MNVEFWVYILILASWPCVARAQDCGEVCQYDGFTELEPGPPFPRIEKNFSCRAIIERTLRPHKPPHKSPISVPKEQMAAYTMNHTATVMRWYFNEVMQSGTHHWTTSMCRAYATPKCIPKRLNYAEWGCALYKYLTKYRMLLAGKVIGVLGSQLPWIECKLLQLGVRQVITIDYGKIIVDIRNLKTTQWPDVARQFLESNEPPLDGVVTFSSVEHSGLGRYGDPLNPYGDLEAMAQTWCLLKPRGVLFAGIPVGSIDTVFWNAQRVYGPKRMKHLFANFKFLDASTNLNSRKVPRANWKFQPTLVLQKVGG